MTNSVKHLKLSIALVAAAAVTLMMLLGGSLNQAAAAEAKCPTFRVLHNDRIGALSVPKGTYNVTVLNSAKLSCPTASKLFAEFLQDYDGKLRKPWVVNVAAKSFTKGVGSTTGFKIKKTTATGPVGNTYGRCPGTFSVLHNDRIGKLVLPKGKYYITVGQAKPLSCKQAANYFRQFLNYPDGKLPAPWKLNAAKARFRAGPGGVVFRVQQA
ncbi:MAG: hypothetical protein ACSLFI_06035 [Solirubrobacterales bacterium]